MGTIFKHFFKDPKRIQLFIQLSILTYAATFNLFPLKIFTVFSLVTIALIFMRAHQKNINEKLNIAPLNTAASLLILLKVEPLWLFPLILALGLLSKFIFKYDKCHLFNPSNIVIVIGLLFFPDFVYIQPGVWGRELLFITPIILAGIYLCRKVGVLTQVFSFITVYSLCHIAHSIGLGNPLRIPLHHLQNGSFIIFSFYAFSDPKTSPKDLFIQLLYGSIVAFISFSLEFSLFTRGAWFYALAMGNLLRPILENLYLPMRKIKLTHHKGSPL